MMKKLSLIVALSASIAPIIAHGMAQGNQSNHANNADRQQITNDWQKSCCECCLAASYWCCLITVAPAIEAYLIVRKKITPPKTARRME